MHLCTNDQHSSRVVLLMFCRVFLVFICLAVAWASQAEVKRSLNAQDLVGVWACTTSDGNRVLNWEVRQDYVEGWLIGRASQGGIVLAIEGWSYDKYGQIRERRQFAANGVYVHMKTTHVQGSVMTSEGYARDMSAGEMRYRHTVKKASDDLLLVDWATDNAERGEYTTIVEERCERGGVLIL